MLQKEIEIYQQLEIKKMKQQSLNNQEKAFMVLFSKLINKKDVEEHEIKLLEKLLNTI